MENILLSLVEDNLGKKVDLDERAKSYITEESTYYERFMLARRFEAFGSYKDAADLLEDRVDYTYNSPALNLLFSALVNSDQRGKAHSLLNKIPLEIQQQPVFLNTIYYLHMRRGDFKSAESIINKMIENEPENLSYHLKRVELWLRVRNEISGFSCTSIAFAFWG